MTLRIRPLFAWYDLWVGAYWDGAKRRLYLLPLPCIGVVVDFAPAVALMNKPGDQPRSSAA